MVLQFPTGMPAAAPHFLGGFDLCVGDAGALGT
jgi:hypothetical protein